MKLPKKEEVNIGGFLIIFSRKLPTLDRGSTKSQKYNKIANFCISLFVL
jgi:hypothetical protein